MGSASALKPERPTCATPAIAMTPTPRKRAGPRSGSTAKSAKDRGGTVADYLAGLGGWQRAVAGRLRTLVKGAAPDAVESIKWGQPVFEVNGPFCYLRAFSTSVNFGFWRGADLADPHRLLQGTGGKMRHVKLSGPGDLDAAALRSLVKQAVALNVKKGDPTRR